MECFWTRSAGSASSPHRVLPDGCIDILLMWPHGAERPSVVTAVGTMTRALVVGAEANTDFIGVRFRPGRALPFLGVPATELTDLNVDVADLWSGHETAFETLESARHADVLAALGQLLQQRAGDAPSNRTVDAAVRAILRGRGNLSVAALAPALGVTRQYLARAFALHVGVPPKTFARIARVRGVLARARVAARPDWAAFALDAGYCDQSHLAGEVKALTGLTPTEWIGAR